MTQRSSSNRFLRHFIDILVNELGQENLSLVLEKASLPIAWADSEQLASSGERSVAEAYAGLQKALRVYYGRGARGILQRAGGNMWKRLLANAPLNAKTQAAFVRRLPLPARRRAALDLLASLLGFQRGDVTVHTLDLDLLLEDHASPGASGQFESEPICYVTLGLLHECLFWATGKEHDIQETSCKATGQESCEFKIITGG
ncbi:MAG: 4-vinyl reductase [Chloroflexota bacterium]